MEAAESSGDSYDWKSILHGRNVIKRGACWRIGNGRDVQIWQHLWLPRKHPSRVQSPMLEGWEETTVNVLINEENRTWNEQLIDGLFVPEEAELVKKIPLSRHSVDDKMFWPWTQSGAYTCKSGYRFLKMEDEEDGMEDVQNGEKVFWQSIWGLRIPNKVKNFLWHACREAIPTKANLKRRHIIENNRCKRCKNEEETVLHALWNCSELDSVWTQIEWSSRRSSGVTCFKELLSWVLTNHRNRELFAMVTWGIWHQ